MVNLLDLRSTEKHISELPQWDRALFIRINWEYSSLQSNTVNPLQPRYIEVPGKGRFACLSPSFMLMSESFLWLLLLPSPLPQDHCFLAVMVWTEDQRLQRSLSCSQHCTGTSESIQPHGWSSPQVLRLSTGDTCCWVTQLLPCKPL